MEDVLLLLVTKLLERSSGLSDSQAASTVADFVMMDDSDGKGLPHEIARKGYEAQRQAAIAAGGTGKEADYMLDYFVKNHSGVHTGDDLHAEEQMRIGSQYENAMQQYILGLMQARRMAIKPRGMSIPTVSSLMI